MTRLITWDNLRPYQKECVERCNSVESGSHLVQMATGLGKTTVPETTLEPTPEPTATPTPVPPPPTATPVPVETQAEE